MEHFNGSYFRFYIDTNRIFWPSERSLGVLGLLFADCGVSSPKFKVPRSLCRETAFADISLYINPDLAVLLGSPSSPT
jgi:hypothetical protein